MDIKFDTLKYLVSDSNIDNSKKILSNAEASKLMKKDKKFYKKRILAVTKKLFKDEDYNNSNKIPRNIFDNYTSKMIEFFKETDLNEVRQTQYKDFEKEESLLNMSDNDIEKLNLMDYDFTESQQVKQKTIEECLNIKKSSKEEKKIFLPIKEEYDLKTKKNKKKRNI